MATQTNYDGDIAQPGQIARSYPFHLVKAETQVDANERMPRPGDAVIWDSTNHAFKIPETNEVPNALGVVVLDGGAIPGRVGSTQDTAVQYADGDQLQVMIRGVVYVRVVTTASETINFGARMIWQPPADINGESDWIEIATASRGPANNPSTTQNLANSLLNLQAMAINLEQVGNSTTTLIPVRLN